MVKHQNSTKKAAKNISRKVAAHSDQSVSGKSDQDLYADDIKLVNEKWTFETDKSNVVSQIIDINDQLRGNKQPVLGFCDESSDYDPEVDYDKE